MTERKKRQSVLTWRHRVELVVCAWMLGFAIGTVNVARHVTGRSH